ncbi:hypothetical protein NIES2109_08370 [Nostoc sp. HK-01]|uniref:Globin-sensor domain-containing protein n=2 Tax=Nostocales TaxID=1161 RepID=A0A1Z4GLA7_9CYAN|nr:hypothetical protein [Nostoc cycadae]BAY18262.1 hypothetical protein NIES21_41060 [Anabaenopsis circularis NIES-21]BBD58068.1 hypothetical protein NIES2109_08370 [Nostoc sp. HK-01]GBE90667.1 cell division protein FtsA [Nostoc cycadae WK-1]
MNSLHTTFAQHLNFSQAQLESILSKSLNEVLVLPELQQELADLDISLLKQTLPTAGAVLAQELPPFYNWLKNELGVKRVPASPDHATAWVIGFINNQESLTHLVELHRPVPHPALETSVPRLISLFDGVEDARVRKEWQKAIAALCLVLVVDAREQDRMSVAA